MALVPNYVPIDWVDTVTPVDEAKMDHIETNIDQHADAINALDTRLAAEEAMPDIPTVVNGQWLKGSSGAMVWSAIAQADVTGLTTALNAKENTANKGAVNGYASLDSGGKVPSSQLPVSIDLRWAGTYAAATAYKEGDVVIYNGVSYMALRPTTGETPQPWSSAAGGSLTSIYAKMTADLVLASGSAYQDITLDQTLALTAGTWLIVGTSFVVRGGNAGWITTKIWDGASSVLAVSEYTTSGLSSGQGIVTPFSAIATISATTTYKMSIVQQANGHTVKATTTQGGIGAPTAVSAVKIG